MSANEKVSVEWEVKLNELTAALQKAGNISENEAKRMVIAVDRQFQASKKAGQDAAKALKASKSGADDMKKSLAAAGQLASSFGGSLGAMGATANAAGTSLANLAGPVLGSVGVAAGITVGAVAALAYGIVQGAEGVNAYIDAADPLIERLKQISGSKPLPPSAVAALDHYRQSSLGAEAASDRLHVEVAALATEFAGPLLDAFTGFVGELADFAEQDGPTIIAIFDDFAMITRVVQGVLTLGGTELVRYAVGLNGLEAAGHAAAAGLDDTARAAAEANARLSAGEKIAGIAAEALLAATGATDAQIAMSKAIDANNDSLNEYIAQLDLSTDAGKAQAEAATTIIEKRNQQIAADERATEADKNAADASAKGAAATAKATATQQDMEKTIGDVAGAISALHTQSAGYYADTLTSGQARAAALASEQAGIDDTAAALTAEIEATDGLTRAEKDRMQATIESTAADAKAAAQLRANRDLDAEIAAAATQADIANADAADGWVKAADDADAKAKSDRQKRRDNLHDDVESVKQYYDVVAQAEQGIADLFGAIGQAKIDEAEEAGGRATDAQKQAALKAFKQQQAFAVATAVIQGGSAYLGEVAALSTFMGPLAFPVAAALVFPEVAAQIVSIKNQAPPSFPLGGLVPAPAPDHRLIAAEPGEVVIDRATTRRNGGANRMIEDLKQGGQHGPSYTINRYRHRDLSIVMADHLRLDTPLSRRLDRVKPPGRRR